MENIVSNLYICGTKLQDPFISSFLFGTLPCVSFVLILSYRVERKGNIYLNKPTAKICRSFKVCVEFFNSLN